MFLLPKAVPHVEGMYSSHAVLGLTACKYVESMHRNIQALVIVLYIENI